MRRILLIACLSHSENSLKSICAEKEINITQLFGSDNLPTGILSMQAYVSKNCPNCQIEIINLNAKFLLTLTNGNIKEGIKTIYANFKEFICSAIIPTLKTFKPDIVGLSALFDKTIPSLILTAEQIKSYSKDILVIAGGNPCTNLYNQIFKETTAIDAICVKEGEIPLLELAKSNNPISYLQEENAFATPKKPRGLNNTLIQNLDDIPSFDLEGYFAKYTDKTLCLHNNVLDTKHSFNKQASIMTSRGCPYNCIFCASGAVHGKKVRAYSINRVKEEIDYYVDNHNVETIGFTDDHFLFDVKRAVEIVNYAGGKNVDVRFPNGLSIKHITKDFVDALVKNNVAEVQLALESGSERVLKEIIRKPLTLKKAEEVFNLFAGTNIFVKLFLVIGLPGETYEDICNGLEFLRKANFGWASISSPVPISGSRLLEYTYTQINKTNYDDFSFFTDSFETKEISAKFNNNIRYTVNLDINFVHNPYMRIGEYKKAQDRFGAIISNYENHAFAWYYLAKCNIKLGLDYEKEYNNYLNIIGKEKFWYDYAKFFDLERERK